jgi:hypothetical protein
MPVAPSVERLCVLFLGISPPLCGKGIKQCLCDPAYRVDSSARGRMEKIKNREPDQPEWLPTNRWRHLAISFAQPRACRNQAQFRPDLASEGSLSARGSIFSSRLCHRLPDHCCSALVDIGWSQSPPSAPSSQALTRRTPSPSPETLAGEVAPAVPFTCLISATHQAVRAQPPAQATKDCKAEA